MSSEKSKVHLGLNNCYMKKWFRKQWLRLKAWFMIIPGEWQDDLIMCPSQCYYVFNYRGVTYCIYLRWRHSDPWTLSMIKNYTLFDNDIEKWTDLPVSFYHHDELEHLKKEALKSAALYLVGYFADEEAEQAAHLEEWRRQYGA